MISNLFTTGDILRELITQEIKGELPSQQLNFNILNIFLNFFITNGIKNTFGDLTAHWLTLCTNGLAFNTLLVYYVSRKVRDGCIVKIGSI